ncbi:MAG: HAD-IC family P-type ATPase, partial [Polyangia bacterium]
MRAMVEAAPISAGLTTAEATARLAEVGPNDPAPRRGRSRLVELLVLFGNPLVVILLVAGVTSAVLGEHVNAALIIAMVALSVVVNFVQTFRSQRAVERLRAGVAPTATVLRDGAFRELPRREVVPGDVVQLGAGDLVPADAKLLQARDLHVHEASLTGESMPVEKEVGAEVCLGTSVVSGNATALVTATCARTQFGEIAARLVAHPPETEFEHGLRRFGGLIMRAVFFLVLFIVVVNLALHRPPFESLLFAVALAVGLTPEFLPMITAVTLTQGAVRMARQKVIVKHLAAIQNFGSIDILCSDKTGTLTAGEMAFDRSLDALGAPSNEPLRLAYLTSRFETGIKSPLDKAILGCAGLDGAGYEKRDELPFDFER